MRSASAEKFYQSHAGWKIGTSRRGDELRASARQAIPAPNKYLPNCAIIQEKSAQFSMGASSRTFDYSKNSPGPGAYKVPTKVGVGPKYNIAGRLSSQSAVMTEYNKTKSNPGVGAYNPDKTSSMTKMPAVSIKGRYSVPKALDVPGPGTYKAYGDDSPMKKKNPTYKMGTEKKGSKYSSISPGPGAYRVPT
jgi:hypothetical protein